MAWLNISLYAIFVYQIKFQLVCEIYNIKKWKIFGYTIRYLHY